MADSEIESITRAIRYPSIDTSREFSRREYLPPRYTAGGDNIIRNLESLARPPRNIFAVREPSETGSSRERGASSVPI